MRRRESLLTRRVVLSPRPRQVELTSSPLDEAKLRAKAAASAAAGARADADAARRAEDRGGRTDALVEYAALAERDAIAAHAVARDAAAALALLEVGPRHGARCVRIFALDREEDPRRSRCCLYPRHDTSYGSPLS